MDTVFKQVPLYRFLAYCDKSGLEKSILDCGAGGDLPPLSLFFEHGYKVSGIELDPGQLKKADDYARLKKENLNISLGDMRNLMIKDKAYSFAYSYNSIFHMKKEDVGRSVAELKRIVADGGLLFVNFLTDDDFRCGTGERIGDNEYIQEDDGKPVIHSYYKDGEADGYFKDMTVIHKEKRIIEWIFEGQRIRQGFVDYIAKKAKQ